VHAVVASEVEARSLARRRPKIVAMPAILCVATARAGE
jgi:hypothetical protein